MRALLSSLILLLAPACAYAPPAPESPEIPTPPALLAEQAFLVGRLRPALPVYVQEGPLLERGLLGETAHFEQAYLITIDYRLDGWAQQLVLIHEWAHVLVWEQGLDGVDPHGVEWGEAYSRVFQAWAGEDK